MDDLKILENSRLFAGIRVDEIQPMLSCLQAVERKYPRGAYIFHTGEEVRALALLVRGTAHIQKEDFWGNRSLLASLAAGDIFAEAYAMPGSGAMRSDVVAVESCTVLLMDVERVLSRCTNSCAFHARLTENLFALLAEKNRILARKADYLAQRTTRQRLLVYLSEQAQRAGQCGVYDPVQPAAAGRFSLGRTERDVRRAFADAGGGPARDGAEPFSPQVNEPGGDVCPRRVSGFWSV